VTSLGTEPLVPGAVAPPTRARIVWLPGDGVGPEVAAEAEAVLRAVAEAGGWAIDWLPGLIGGAAIDRDGVPLTDETLEAARSAHAVFKGPVGGPRWDHLRGPARCEAGLLRLRQGMGVFANLRPTLVTPALAAGSPLRPEVLGEGVDLLIVRELTGGAYFAQPKGREGDRAVDTMAYSRDEIERVAHVAFRAARLRRRRLTSVDKANVLESSRLWRDVVDEVARQYPDVRLEHQLVDSCAMLLVTRPTAFDVILTENLFGDILSDEAGVLAGSLGVLPSASLGAPGRPGLYEPVHGAAPDIAGQGQANPIASILSIALMLRYSLGRPREAQAVEGAVRDVIEAGVRTRDIAAPGQAAVGTRAMGAAVRQRLARAL
jgi:3-isopropylmalate dehydrogenase